MPLLAGGLTPPPPIVFYPVEIRDAAQARWIDPTGREWPLTNAELGWATLDEVSGLGATPISMATDSAPYGGTTIRHIQPVARTVTWPLHIFGRNHTEFIARYRQLATAFTQTRRRGPGKLVIGRPDGTEREIAAYYQAGFDSSPGAAHLHDDVVLSLYCPDAYWQGREELTEYREYATSSSYLTAYPTISSAMVFGQTHILNPGDVEAYPVWTITGPAETITVENLTTGDSFTVDPDAPGIAHGDLLADETITISTYPPSVIGPDGSVWTAALDWPGARLFPLEPGQTDISFGVVGAADGTRISVSYRPRYETA